MKLSVCLITYNHGKFISQALDSILMQEVDFDYEIVIGEDCSTDNTRKIISDYRERHPDKIRLILRDRNVGHMENIIQTYRACRGKYVATMDGDDYWISPHKLQRQVDFLEHNDDFAVVYHRIIHRDELDGTLHDLVWPVDPKEVSTIEDLMKECFLHTSAVMYRNKLFSDFPGWVHSVMFEDWTMHVLHAQHGKIKCLDDVMAVYRIHGEGMWSKLHKPEKHMEYVKFYNYLNSHFNKKYESIIRRRIRYHDCVLSLLYYEMALENEDRGCIGDAKNNIVNSFIHNPMNRKIKEATILFKEIPLNKEKIKLFVRLYFPWAYGMLKNIKLLVSRN